METRQAVYKSTLRGFNAPVTAHDLEQFNAGLSGPLSDYDLYRADRDAPGKPVPYVAPQETRPAPIFPTAAIVPVLKGVGLAVAVGVLLSSGVALASGVACAISAFCTTYAMYIGGGIVLLVGLVIGLSSLFSGKADNGPGPGGEKGWEFFQEQSQRQGWREK